MPSTKIGVITGVTVFTINMIENIVHYSIGKENGNGNLFKFHFPEKTELLKMVGTSFFAGFLVGSLTKLISKKTIQ